MSKDPKDYIGRRYRKNLNNLATILAETYILGENNDNLEVNEYDSNLSPTQCYFNWCNHYDAFSEIKNYEVVLNSEDGLTTSKYFFHEDCLDRLILKGIKTVKK